LALAQSPCAIWCHFELIEEMTMAQKPLANWVLDEFTDPRSETAVDESTRGTGRTPEVQFSQASGSFIKRVAASMSAALKANTDPDAEPDADGDRSRILRKF
jgi:hypothetical protein